MYVKRLPDVAVVSTSILGHFVVLDAAKYRVNPGSYDPEHTIVLADGDGMVQVPDDVGQALVLAGLVQPINDPPAGTAPGERTDGEQGPPVAPDPATKSATGRGAVKTGGE